MAPVGSSREDHVSVSVNLILKQKFYYARAICYVPCMDTLSTDNMLWISMAKLARFNILYSRSRAPASNHNWDHVIQTSVKP